MEPINKKMAIKKVAGFHSLDFFFNWRFSFRSGFGTRDLQNEPSTMVAGAVLENRIPRRGACDVVNARDTARALLGRIASFRSDMLKRIYRLSALMAIS